VSEPFTRKVLADDLAQGHALATADLDGDGRDEIIAGHRGTGWRLLVFRAHDGGGRDWERVVVDDGGMAAAGVVVVDLDGDGRLDLVAGGRGSNNIKWYRNETALHEKATRKATITSRGRRGDR
jgi:hypothetical protein